MKIDEIPVVEFGGYKCSIQISMYINGNTAIQLVNADKLDEDGHISEIGSEIILTATLNIEEHLAKNEVIIKNYSENEGILDILIDSGIISNPVNPIRTGFEQSAFCKLLIDL